MRNFCELVSKNLGYAIGFLVIIAMMFVIAILIEKFSENRIKASERDTKSPTTAYTRKIVVIGMLSAVARILMLLEIPMPFAPGFYKLDFSEIAPLVGGFAFGPVAAVTVEFIKILLKLITGGSSTAMVGELANFTVGCSFVLPAVSVYSFKKTKSGALKGLIAGTATMTVFGTAFNALYLLPAFAALYKMPLEAILEMGEKVNPFAGHGNTVSFVMACVAPLNLIKGTSVSILTLLIYKKISPIMKGR